VVRALALHHEGTTRSDVITAVWPHLPPSSIVQRLHTTLSDLRRQLQPTGINPVTRQGDIYHLNTDMVRTDVAEWRTTVAVARSTIGEVARGDACHKLMQLYQGELAAGEPWPWIQPAREQFRRDALDACIHIADQAPPAEALTWLENAVTIEPFSAPLQARLIQLRAATSQGLPHGKQH
jgi:DNA-binding SARP family transcriptional activator